MATKGPKHKRGGAGGGPRRYSEQMSDSGNRQDDEARAPEGEETQAPGEATAGPGPDGGTASPGPEDATATPNPGDTTATPNPGDTAATSKPEDATSPGGGSEKGFRGRVSRPGEDTIGKLAQDLLEHPMVTGALSAVFETRERATRAQEVAMSALNLPSASDIERLTRRLRSVSQRLEGLEDGIDQVADRLDKLGPLSELHARLDAIEAALGRIEAKLGSESD